MGGECVCVCVCAYLFVCVVSSPHGVRVAQWIRHPPTKREIAGSSPVVDFLLLPPSYPQHIRSCVTFFSCSSHAPHMKPFNSQTVLSTIFCFREKRRQRFDTLKSAGGEKGAKSKIVLFTKKASTWLVQSVYDA